MTFFIDIIASFGIKMDKINPILRKRRSHISHNILLSYLNEKSQFESIFLFHKNFGTNWAKSKNNKTKLLILKNNGTNSIPHPTLYASIKWRVSVELNVKLDRWDVEVIVRPYINMNKFYCDI